MDDSKAKHPVDVGAAPSHASGAGQARPMTQKEKRRASPAFFVAPVRR